MSDSRCRVLPFIVVQIIGSIVLLQACGGEEAVGSGFVTCLTADDGFLSCDEYCASISRACMICNCPDALKDNILCDNNRQYSAFGWKSNARCQGDPSTAFSGCMQSVFYGASGSAATVSVKCCCE